MRGRTLRAPTRRSARLARRDPQDENVQAEPALAPAGEPTALVERQVLADIGNAGEDASSLTALPISPRDETRVNLPGNPAGPAESPGQADEPPDDEAEGEPSPVEPNTRTQEEVPGTAGRELFYTARTSVEEAEQGSANARASLASSFRPDYFSGNKVNSNESERTSRRRSRSLSPSRLAELRETEEREIAESVAAASAEDEAHISSLEERFRAIREPEPIDTESITELDTYRDTPNPFWSGTSSGSTIGGAESVSLGSMAPVSPHRHESEGSPGLTRSRSLSEPTNRSSERQIDNSEDQEDPGSHESIQVSSASIEVDKERIYHEISDDEEPARPPKGKGKEKAKEQKRKKRPDLGVRIDDIQPGSSRARSHTPHSRKNRADESSFMAGGYLAAIHGSAQKKKKTYEKKGRKNREPSDDEDPSSSSSSDGSSDDESSSSDSENSESDFDSSESGSSSSSDSEDDDENPDPSDDGNDPDAGDPDDDDDDDPEPEQGDDDLEDRRRRKCRAAEKKLKKQRRLIRKLEHKIKRQKRSNFKASEPQKYSGEEDYDKFELFCYVYDNWVKDVRFSDKEAVRHVGRYLTGKAATWYMTHCAVDRRSFSMRKVYNQLFEYCFPPGFKEELRKQYNEKRQNKTSVQDYFAEYNVLRKRLPEINERQHIQRVWEGAELYIRMAWINKGYHPDVTSLEKLRKHALRTEKADRLKKQLERQERDRDHHRGDRRDRRRSRSPKRDDRNGGSSSHNHGGNSRSQGRRDKGRRRDGDGRRNNGGGSRNGGGQRRNDGPPNNGQLRNQDNRLSRAERDELRAANKCFNCKNVGHLAKDCPSRNRSRPSGPSTSAVRIQSAAARISDSTAALQELERLSQTRDAIEVSAVAVADAHIVTQTRTRKTPEIKHVERNAARMRDATRLVPSTLVVEAKLAGKQVRVLLDSGSQADLVSTTIADQLRLELRELTKPLTLQLAVSGSRGSINYSATCKFEYQDIDETRTFDIANIDNYDVILGSPFLFQHKVRLCLNPPSVFIGSNESVPIEGNSVVKINSRAADVVEARLEELRKELTNEANDICKGLAETQLPPLRAINHVIPLLDEDAIYKNRPSKCPEAMKALFDEKYRVYVDTGRWRHSTGTNATPMLYLKKKTKDGSIQLRTVLDKRNQNANTHKLASPLPDIEEILETVSRFKYRTLLDGKDAYEQIRVEPKDVPKTLFHTPHGTMVSLVMQQGDCNAGATYQSLMNHLFSAHIGRFMYVYLDDIIIFNNTIEDHVKGIRTVFDILRKERLFLSSKKMQFFADRLSILGHVVDDKGIAMDPDKVDAVSKWKTPNSKEQVLSFLGAVSYLAPNCPGIRIPMAVLTKISSANGQFRWEGTERRAFDEVKATVEAMRNAHRVALKYEKDAEPINLVTDASLTGASGFISQGDDWKKASVAKFWSGKFNPAQQNYAVHDRELLAIVASMKRFQSALHGVRFRILTDHRALEHLMTQRNLSARQARWLDFMSGFDFTITYIEGSTNVFADALSRIYSTEAPGTLRAVSEYVGEYDGEELGEPERMDKLTSPVLTGYSAEVAEGPRRNPARNRRAPIRLDPSIPGRDAPRNTRVHPKKAGAPPSETTGAKQNAPEKRQNRKVTVDEITDLDAPKIVKPAEADRPDESPPRSDELEGGSPQPELQNELISGIAESTEACADYQSFTDGLSEMDIVKAVRGKHETDEQFKKITTELDRYPNFKIEDGLLTMNDQGLTRLCVPNVELAGRSVREILISHAHTTLAHLGNKKTYAYIHENVWWPSMRKDVEAFYASCTLCAANKSMTTLPYGLLKPLPVPVRPWQQIGIDFVGPLPASRTLSGEFDMICVVIDHLTSMVHLIPTRQDYRATDVAEILYLNVYKLHGIPEVIVSDRDSLFTSTFWRKLHELIGSELRFSSAYHPQTDGMTERANKTIVSMVRQSVNPAQRNWAHLLPGVEFAFNLAKSETTGFSPFALNYGRSPRPMIFKVSTDLKGIREMAYRLKDSIMAAHDAILSARVNQTPQANKHRREAPFAKNDLVYVSTRNMSLPVGKARKLAPKYIGPYRIVREASKGASYEVDLDAEMKRRGMHPVFHASLLRPHIPNDDRKFPGRLYKQIVSIHGDSDEWAVERIVDHSGKGARATFLIEWKSGDQTWEPLASIRHLEALNQYFETLGIRAAHELPKRDGNTQIEEVPNSQQDVGGIEKGLGQLPVQTASVSDVSHSLAGLVPSLNTSSITISTAQMMTNDLYSILIKRWVDGGVFPGEPPESWRQANPETADLLFPKRSNADEPPELSIRGKARPGGRGRYRSHPYDSSSSTYARSDRPENPELTVGTLARLWEGSQRQFDSLTAERDHARARASASRFSGRARGRPRGFGHPSGLNHSARRSLGKRGFKLGPLDSEGAGSPSSSSRGPGAPSDRARDGPGDRAQSSGAEHQHQPHAGPRTDPDPKEGADPSPGKEGDARRASEPPSSAIHPLPASLLEPEPSSAQGAVRNPDAAKGRVEDWRQNAMDVDDSTTVRGTRVGTPSEFAVSELPPVPEDEQEGLTGSFGALGTAVPPSA